MNSKLDILIEKYLDGNISKKDQTELNNLITNDKESKGSFQNADALKKLVKQDAQSIEYPEEFFSGVQDLILMKYLQEAPQEATIFVDLKNAYPKQLYSYVRYAAVIVIFFLASIISINEFMPFNTSKMPVKETVSNTVNNRSNSATEQNSIKNISQPNAINLATRDIKNTSYNTNKNQLNALPLKADISPKEISTPNIAIDIEDEETYVFEPTQLLNQFEELSTLNDIEFDTENINSETKINSFSALDRLRIQDNSILPIDYKDINQLNFVSAYNFGLEDFGLNKINFVAMASNGFASNGLQLSDNKISSYSQSISYNIDQKSVIGVELGLTEFSAKVLRDVVLVSQNTSGPDDDFTGKDLIRVKIPLKQKTQLVWTTIFYERTIFQMKNTELAARVGLGLTNSDPVYIAKILGKQRIYKDLFLTLGVDTRYYKTSINGTINGDFLSTFNIIYGLQYSL